jgi:REP element-mobilizing transposase RayT
MPDHIHAIVSIDSGKTPHNKRSIESLYAINNGVMTHDGDEAGNIEPQKNGTSTQFATQMQTWLSVVIRMFKSSVTGFAKANSIPFGWQTRFHDHIIRNNEELNGIAQYIENNVAKWILDKCR